MIIAPCSTVRAAEQAAFAAGQTDPESLTRAVVQRLHRTLREHGIGSDTAVVYAGKGGNARDAVGLAALCAERVLLRCAHEADANALAEYARSYAPCAVEIALQPPQAQGGMLLIDGLLGSGASGGLRPAYAAAVAEINELRSRCEHSLTIAVDIPTGLDAETGHVCGDAVRADITCPIGCVKPGMSADGAEDYVGRLLPVELPGIVLTPSTEDKVLSAEESIVQLPRRAHSCFKNRAGRVAVIAGSQGMLGAARLCAEAALRAGAGLVVLYCHRDIYPLLAASVCAEVMVRPVESYADIEEPQAQALVIGPGLGHPSAAEAEALRALAHSFAGTVVLDADALNLAAAQAWSFTPNMILTPHPGEMRRLDSRPSVSRRETVSRFLAEHDVTLLLKGARTLIADRHSCLYNGTGGPYMANGGQGDVLAGVIGALAAQGCRPLHAAAAGAYRCGLAAEQVYLRRLRERRVFPAVVTAAQVIQQL